MLNKMEKLDFNKLSDMVKAGGNPFAGLLNDTKTAIDNDKAAMGNTTRAWFEKWLYDHAIFP